MEGNIWFVAASWMALRSSGGNASSLAEISALIADGTPVVPPRSAIVATNSSANRGLPAAPRPMR